MNPEVLNELPFQHSKSNTFIVVFVGRARVGPVILKEPSDVTSQVVKSIKQSLLLCVSPYPTPTTLGATGAEDNPRPSQTNLDI